MSLKILTVDDSKTIRMIVSKAFAEYDCTVLEAEDGVVALAVAAHNKPDLIILDYTMPVMNGLETLARLRSSPDLKFTPVIMLTAEAGRDTVVKIAKFSVRDYLIKPFKEDLLIDRVKRVVNLRRKDEGPKRRRRYDDPIHILLLEDKAAIIEQFKAGLADTNWQITCRSDATSAMGVCQQGGVDIVLASLSLPNDGAFMFTDLLRTILAGHQMPVFGLSVKTAVAEQTRAQQAGFAKIISKPINFKEVKAKITSALRLDVAYKYFQTNGAALILTIPSDPDQSVLDTVADCLNEQITATVDAGNEKLVIDLSQIPKINLPIIQLALAAKQLSDDLSIETRVIASEEVRREAQSYEETRNWQIAHTLQEALDTATCPAA